MLVPDRLFQPSLMVVGKDNSLPYREHLKGALLGSAPAFLANIRQVWKGLPWTNTLVYYEHLYITTVKFFITLGPGVKVAKLFYSSPSTRPNKL